MQISPFLPQGNSYTVTAATTAPTPVQVIGVGPQCDNYLITVVGVVPVFLGVGNTSSLATSNAVIPSVGTPAAGIPVLPNSQSTISAPPNSYFTAITSSGTASVYITPGEGI